MIDTKAKRAAALGYGLAFLIVLPPADAVIGIEDAGHALSAYQFDMPATFPGPVDVVNLQFSIRRTVTVEAGIRRTVNLDATIRRTVDLEVER